MDNLDDTILRVGVLEAIQQYKSINFDENSNDSTNMVILPPFNMNVAVVLVHNGLWYPYLGMVKNNQVVSTKPLDINNNLMVQYCEYVSELGQM